MIQAEGGQEPILLFGLHRIDLVLLDCWMPKSYGVALARQIKSMKPGVPIIMFSDYAELPGEAAGFVDRWIVKTRAAGEPLKSVRRLLQQSTT